MRRELKVAIVAAGLKHQEVANQADGRLPPEEHLSEHDITRLVTKRKTPTVQQAAALAEVLGHSPAELFPEVRR